MLILFVNLSVMMRVLLVTSILLLIGSAHATLVFPNKSGFQTTFFDPFYGEPGSLPSSSKWLIDIGTSYPGGYPHWGNNELESYTNDSSNLAITTAHTLAITPRLSKAGNWTSGKIETVKYFKCNEGGKLWIEARLKLGRAPESKQQGIWPAFWALGAKYRGNYTNWPMVSEWDILESVNGAPKMYTTIHCGTSPGGPCNELSGIASHTNFTQWKWHKVGFEVDRSMSGYGGSGTWKDEKLSWYLDGELVFNVTGARVNDSAAWTELAHEDHFLLLNVAVGGSFPNAIAGSPTPTNATIGGKSVRMQVDYVGVWNSL